MKTFDINEKKRIVVKVGSHSLTHADTGYVDYVKIERLVMELCNLKNTGRDVILVTSGAMATGRQTLGIKKEENESMAKKQALASIGQARLMSLYEKYFFEYNQVPGQVLLSKNNVFEQKGHENASNTFRELLKLGIIPVVNANDTIATDEIQFGDNDTLGAVIGELVEADLLILLTDTEGLYTDNPKSNPDARLISEVEHITKEHFEIASGETGSDMGTGGMRTKLRAGRIATSLGMDMIVASGSEMAIIHRLFEGHKYGTLFHADYDPTFDMAAYIQADIYK